MVFVHNAHRFMDDVSFVQGVWNLRDQLKQDRRMLVMLGPAFRLPPEIAGDVVLFDEALPDSDQIRDIITEVHDSAGVTVSQEALPRAVSATTGLPAFQVEQLTAMSLTPDGLVVDDLWERKRKQIEQTPGLSVYRGPEGFADIGGVAYAKRRFSRICGGLYNPQAIVWIDEIDKQMDAEGDLSGVSKYQLGALLTYMEERKVKGVMCVGPPGCSKSLIAKAAGNEHDIPTIAYDMGAMKAGIVGESEMRTNQCLKVISSVSNGRPLFVATANSVQKLNTALLRRFPVMFYFDLPDDDERRRIWPIHISRRELDSSQNIPDDRLWSGADIRNCVESAWEERISLVEAAEGIVPVGIRSAKEIDALRQEANGKYLSASYPGVYRMASVQQGTARRAM